MSLGVMTADSAAVDLARECVYRFLAAALSDPRGDRFRLALDPEDQLLACRAADLLRAEAGAAPGRLGLGELPPGDLALEPVCMHLQGPPDGLTADYDRTFGLAPCRECPPFETEYHAYTDAFFRAQQMADVAGFYRAFGLTPAADLSGRPDHVAAELAFLSFVLLKKRLALAEADDDPEAADRASVCEEARQAFFRDHIAWWVPAFATGLRRKAGAGLYAAVGRALAALIHVERRTLGVDTPSIPAQPSRDDPAEEPGACGDCTAKG
jgi:TorA maturation chaperone TorD